MSSTVNVTGNVTLLIGNQGSQGGTMLIVNLDASNTIWVNENTQVQYGGPQGIPVPPGGSISMTSTQGLWAVSSGPVVQVALIPNGTAYFLPASLISIGGAKVYVQSAMPTGIIPPNSIWFNTTTNALETWNGTRWVTQQFSGQALILPATLLGSQLANGTLTSAQLAAAAGILGSQIASATITGGNIAANTIVASNIAANTITAAELAANIVYAGIVNGTTITGANFIATGSSGDILVYSGTPAAGNLIASVSPVSGTDSHGNTFTQGIGSYQESNGSAIIMEAGTPAFMGIYTGDSAQADPGLVTSNILGSGATRSLLTQLVSPRVTGSGAYGYVLLESPTVNLAGGAGILFGTSSSYSISMSMSDGSASGNANFAITGWFEGAQSTLLATLPNNLFVGLPLVAQTPGTNGTEEIWHTATLTNASHWTVNSPIQYKFYPDNTVAIRGECTVASGYTVAYGETLFTLPAGYIPATNARMSINYNTGSSSVTPVLITANTSGAIQTYEAIAAGNTLNISIRFPLD